MENNKQAQEIKEVKEKAELNLSCNLRIDQPKSNVVVKKEVKFNTIISDPQDEHPDSHLWE